MPLGLLVERYFCVSVYEAAGKGKNGGIVYMDGRIFYVYFAGIAYG